MNVHSCRVYDLMSKNLIVLAKGKTLHDVQRIFRNLDHFELDSLVDCFDCFGTSRESLAKVLYQACVEKYPAIVRRADYYDVL